MSRERPNDPQPFTTTVFMALGRLRCPADGELRGDSVGAVRFEESDKLSQTRLVFAQLISKSSAKIDILTEIFSQVSHCSPPGHG